MQTHVGKKNDAQDAPCLDSFITTKAMQTWHAAPRFLGTVTTVNTKRMPPAPVLFSTFTCVNAHHLFRALEV